MSILDAPIATKAAVNRSAAAAYRALTDKPFPDNGVVHPSPPTITHSTAQPLSGTLTTYSRNTSQITLQSIVPVDKNGTYIINNADSLAVNYPSWGWSTYVNGTDLVIKWYPYPVTSNNVMQIWIDDMPLYATYTAPSGVTPSNGVPIFTRIQFAASGFHKVTVQWNYMALANLYTPVTTQLSPVTQKRLKVACVGASFTGLTGYYYPAQAWPYQFGRMLNVEVLQAAIGSTGHYYAGSNTVYGNSARVSVVAAWSPDLIVMEGSGNDDGNSLAVVQAAAASTFSAYAIALPSTPIIVIGAMPRSASITLSAARGDNVNGVKAAAMAAPNVIGFIDPCGTPAGAAGLSAYTTGASYAVGSLVTYLGAVWKCTIAIGSAPATFDDLSWQLLTWLTGTGYVGATTGDGPRDVLVGADGTHPTVAGQQSFASHIAREVRKVLIAAAA